MLVVLGGLPGTGKSTVARAVAQRHSAVYLRIDAIEQAIRDADVLAGQVGPAGYAVANAIAEANLANGLTVVADCVNPVAESRAAWRCIAGRVAVLLVEIEIVCSDKAEHRRRVEQRTADIPGLVYPSWPDVIGREYQPWHAAHQVDTAGLDPGAAVAAVERAIDAVMARGAGLS